MASDMGTFQWITVGFLIINGLGMPVIIWVLTQARADRKERFSELHGRLTHLDECFEEVKDIVIGKAVTREDLLAHRNEVTDTINRMRLAISNETNGLHDRLMRLENRFFLQPPPSMGD